MPTSYAAPLTERDSFAVLGSAEAKFQSDPWIRAHCVSFRISKMGINNKQLPARTVSSPNIVLGMQCRRARLDELVPAGRHDDRVGSDRREADTGHPLGVAVRLADGVLALAQRVPQLDGLVAGPRHDLRQSSGGLSFSTASQQPQHRALRETVADHHMQPDPRLPLHPNPSCQPVSILLKRGVSTAVTKSCACPAMRIVTPRTHSIIVTSLTQSPLLSANVASDGV